MQSNSTSVAEYLAELPADRRETINAVRKVILANLDRDNIEEGIMYGMICYFIPHRVYPAGYHCKPTDPLPFAGLASQKNHLSLYLMCVYGSEEDTQKFQREWAKTGKRLDMGKSCIRFKKTEELALDVVAKVFRDMNAQRYISRYEKYVLSVKGSKAASSKKPVAPTKPVKKTNESQAKSSKTTKKVDKVAKGGSAKKTASTEKPAKKAAKSPLSAKKK